MDVDRKKAGIERKLIGSGSQIRHTSSNSSFEGFAFNFADAVTASSNSGLPMFDIVYLSLPMFGV